MYTCCEFCCRHGHHMQSAMQQQGQDLAAALLWSAADSCPRDLLRQLGFLLSLLVATFPAQVYSSTSLLDKHGLHPYP